VDRPADKLAYHGREAVGHALAVPVLVVDALAFDVTEFAQGLTEAMPHRRIVDDSDARDRCLLRVRRERPPSRRAADQRDQLAPSHSIPSSAIESTPGGIVSPSVLAVLRLIVSSSLVACSIGSSAGLAPCRSRCTYHAPRLNKTGRDAPYAMRPPALTFSFSWYMAGRRCDAIKLMICIMCRWPRGSAVMTNSFGRLCIIAAKVRSKSSLVRIGAETN